MLLVVHFFFWKNNIRCTLLFKQGQYKLMKIVVDLYYTIVTL